MTREDVLEVHRRRAAAFQEDAERLGARSRLVSNLRGLAFAVAAASLGFAAFGDAGAPPLGLGAGALALFGGLVALHSRVIGEELMARRRQRISELAVLRCQERFSELPLDGAELTAHAGALVEDLDLLGPGSLFQRLSVTHTRLGAHTLAVWLSEPSTREASLERQEAVRALAPLLDFREEVEALTLAAFTPPGTTRPRDQVRPPDPEPFLTWAERPAAVASRAWLRPAALAATALVISGLVGVTLFHLPLLALALPLFATQALNLATRRAVLESHLAVSLGEGALSRYARVLERYEECTAHSALLDRRRTELLSGDERPSVATRKLRALLGWFDLRSNGLVHPIANLLLCWDLHCALALDAWKLAHGRRVRKWLVALGELEALSSLAGLAHDEPGWVFPTLDGAPGELHAESLGHPLLPTARRVSNDLSLPGPGHALLVTGSNMSGKSTFLRTVGLAVVLAQAGAPVPARRLRLGPLQLCTSIRVRDSLSAGASHFYAEVERLRRALEATSTPPPVLFLLDEILHGTNSRERTIGARWVLAELLRRGATGLVTTHDLELCRLPADLEARVAQAHFRETLEGESMTFDYRLRPGPVESGNALRVMRLAGLDVPLE